MRNIAGSLQEKFVRVSLLAGFVIAGQGMLAQAQQTNASTLPPGKGRDLISVVCTQCHSLAPILMLRDGAQGWRNFVQEMVMRGAQATPEEAETIIQYLAENLGPGKNPPATGSETGAETKVSLPSGAGKELVESRCPACHDLGRVVATKRTKADWESVTKSMVDRGAQATPQETQAISSYLSSQFGK